MISVPVSDVVGREGQRMVLECRVSSDPVPTVEWFKDGEKVMRSICCYEHEHIIVYFRYYLINENEWRYYLMVLRGW
jgi:hypothetical protein